jgi:hypothetical protein
MRTPLNLSGADAGNSFGLALADCSCSSAREAPHHGPACSTISRFSADRRLRTCRTNTPESSIRPSSTPSNRHTRWADHTPTAEAQGEDLLLPAGTTNRKRVTFPSGRFGCGVCVGEVSTYFRWTLIRRQLRQALCEALGCSRATVQRCG